MLNQQSHDVEGYTLAGCNQRGPSLSRPSQPFRVHSSGVKSLLSDVDVALLRFQQRLLQPHRTDVREMYFAPFLLILFAASLKSTLRLEASGAGLGCCCCCCCCCRACAMAAAIMSESCSRLGMVPPPASSPGIVSLSLCAVLRYLFTSYLRWRLYGNVITC